MAAGRQPGCTGSRRRLPLPAAAAAAALLLALAAARTAVAQPCDQSLEAMNAQYYGACSCKCQTIDGFSCSDCPVTCGRYVNRCKPAKVCSGPPPVTAGVLWSPKCDSVAAGAKCYGNCRLGYNGIGATVYCSGDGANNGWTAPSIKCFPKPDGAPGQQGAAAQAPEPSSPPAPAATPVPSSPPAAQTPAPAPSSPPPAPASAPAPTASSPPAAPAPAPAQAPSSPPPAPAPAPAQAPSSPPAAPSSATAAPEPAPSGGSSKCQGGVPSMLPANAAPWPEWCRNKKPGDACTTGCSKGFMGEPSSTCQPSGEWGAVGGGCEPLKCKGNPKPMSGTWWDGCDGTLPGKSCTARCTADSFGTGYTATCSADGQWQLPSGSGCTDIVCGSNPPAVQGGSWPNCAGFRVGEVCVIATCLPGYDGDGFISNCMLDGTWDRPWGSCNATAAAAPAAPPAAGGGSR